MKHHDTWRSPQLYRDPRNGKLMGVCAGIAGYIGWNVTFTRVIAIMALIWFHVLALVAYFALGFLLPLKPDDGRDTDTDEKYWRSARHSTDNSFRDTTHRFGERDEKLRRRESNVTSSRYDLERAFRDLEH